MFLNQDLFAVNTTVKVLKPDSEIKVITNPSGKTLKLDLYTLLTFNYY